MTDDPLRGPDAAVVPPGIYEHWCEHPGCPEWGAYGYQAGKSQQPHFYCREHRDDGEQIIGRRYIA